MKRVYVMDCGDFVKIGVSGNTEMRKMQIPYQVMDLSATRFDTLCRLLNLCMEQHLSLETYHAQSCTQSLKSLRGHLLIFITSFIGEYTTKEGELK